MRCGGDTPDPEAGRKEPSSRRGANLLPEGGRGGRGVRVPQQRRGRGRTAPPCSARPAVLMSFSWRSWLCKIQTHIPHASSCRDSNKAGPGRGGAAHVGGNAPRAASVNICQEAVCTESASLCNLFIIFLPPAEASCCPRSSHTHTHTPRFCLGVCTRRPPRGEPRHAGGSRSLSVHGLAPAEFFAPAPAESCSHFEGGERNAPTKCF